VFVSFAHFIVSDIYKFSPQVYKFRFVYLRKMFINEFRMYTYVHHKINYNIHIARYNLFYNFSNYITFSYFIDICYIL